MEYRVKITSVEKVTHDVIRITTAKPDGYNFIPGQATEVAIDKDGWRNERRPFTFTCLPGKRYLEFTIKTYPAHNGVTNELRKINVNDTLILHDVFGAISYRGEGVFIAGGAGVTPFIAIFRNLASKNEIGDNILIFANKTKDDIILAEEFMGLLGKNFVNILSEDAHSGFHHGFITAEFLKSYFSGDPKNVYLCGPDPMMESVEKQLKSLNVDPESIVKEVF